MRALPPARKRGRMKRTHLPLNALRVFDAAARHLSFTRAADELAVTPAAVGQQIRALEDVLGVVLFRRTSKGLELTDEAIGGLDPLREGFLRFEEAVQAMQAGQSSHSYAIAAPHEFWATWLAPRLAEFRAANPDVRYQLIAGEEIDFTEANLDLAVRLAEGPGDLEGVQLAPAQRVVVATTAPRQTGSPGPARLCPMGRSRCCRSAMPRRRSLPRWPGWARRCCRCCWWKRRWQTAGSRRSRAPSRATAPIGWSPRVRNGGRRKCAPW